MYAKLIIFLYKSVLSTVLFTEKQSSIDFIEELIGIFSEIHENYAIYDCILGIYESEINERGKNSNLYKTEQEWEYLKTKVIPKCCERLFKKNTSKMMIFYRLKKIKERFSSLMNPSLSINMQNIIKSLYILRRNIFWDVFYKNWAIEPVDSNTNTDQNQKSIFEKLYTTLVQEFCKDNHEDVFRKEISIITDTIFQISTEIIVFDPINMPSSIFSSFSTIDICLDHVLFRLSKKQTPENNLKDAFILHIIFDIFRYVTRICENREIEYFLKNENQQKEIIEKIVNDENVNCFIENESFFCLQIKYCVDYIKIFKFCDLRQEINSDYKKLKDLYLPLITFTKKYSNLCNQNWSEINEILRSYKSEEISLDNCNDKILKSLKKIKIKLLNEKKIGLLLITQQIFDFLKNDTVFDSVDSTLIDLCHFREDSYLDKIIDKIINQMIFFDIFNSAINENQQNNINIPYNLPLLIEYLDRITTIFIYENIEIYEIIIRIRFKNTELIKAKSIIQFLLNSLRFQSIVKSSDYFSNFIADTNILEKIERITEQCDEIKNTLQNKIQELQKNTEPCLEILKDLSLNNFDFSYYFFSERCLQILFISLKNYVEILKDEIMFLSNETKIYNEECSYFFNQFSEQYFDNLHLCTNSLYLREVDDIKTFLSKIKES